MDLGHICCSEMTTLPAVEGAVGRPPRFHSRSEMLASRHTATLHSEQQRFGDGLSRSREPVLRSISPPQYSLHRAATPQEATQTSWKSRFHSKFEFRDPDANARSPSPPFRPDEVRRLPLDEVVHSHPRYHPSRAMASLLPAATVKPASVHAERYLHLRTKVEPRPKSGTLEPTAPMYSSFSSDFVYPLDPTRAGSTHGSNFSVTFGPPRLSPRELAKQMSQTRLSMSTQLIR